MPPTLNGATRLFPIIGDPVIYARSPELLTRSFAERGFNGISIPMQVKDGDLEGALRGISLIPNIDGLLVTMPHKFTALTYCATLSDTSRLLGSVSVMRRNPDGSWHGDITDGLAFIKAQQDQGAQVSGARALLLGAGGAGSAIAIALAAAGVRELIIHDQQEGRAAALIERLAAAGIGQNRIFAGAPDPRGCDMVCNATPMGMADGDPLPVNTDLLGPENFVGDVVAGHGETPLLRAARAKNCHTANGDQMVVAVQAMMVDFMLGAWRAVA